MTVIGQVTAEGDFDQRSDYAIIVFPKSGLYYALYSDANRGNAATPSATFSTVLQTAINNLTTGRTSKQRIVVKGAITTTANVALDSYMILDLSEAVITRSGSPYHMFSASSKTDIDIVGGIINSSAVTGENYTSNEIDFDGVTNFTIDNVTVNNAAEDAIRIKGASSNGKVTRCSLIGSQTHAIAITGTTAHHITISDNYVNDVNVYDAITVFVNGGHSIAIVGNICEKVDGSAASSAAIQIEDTGSTSHSNITCVGNTINDCQYGIVLATAARPVVVTGNAIRNCDRCILVMNATSSVISNNTIDNSEAAATAYGIYVIGLVRGVIANNTIKGAATVNYGIYWDEVGAYAENSITGNVLSGNLVGMRYVPSRSIVANNVIRESNQDAIEVQDGAADVVFSNNLFYNNGQATDNTYHDIDVEASAGTPTVRLYFYGNISRNDATNDIANHINFQTEASTNNIAIMGEVCTGQDGAVISGTPASAFIVRNNPSFVTENSGTGSIASGATTDVITHGLSYTPTAAEIVITLTENPTNTPGAIWVDTIDGTNFTVNCENDPGASNLDFSWSVRRI